MLGGQEYVIENIQTVLEPKSKAPRINGQGQPIILNIPSVIKNTNRETRTGS